MKKLLITAVTIAVLTGCTMPKSHYYWGEYENLIYKTYNTPGEATPDIQIAELEEDIEKAKAKGMPIPPGLYAHLGFMYASNGSISLALEAFETEKSLFPESSVLIDGMIQRVTKSEEGS